MCISMSIKTFSPPSFSVLFVPHSQFNRLPIKGHAQYNTNQSILYEPKGAFTQYVTSIKSISIQIPIEPISNPNPILYATLVLSAPAILPACSSTSFFTSCTLALAFSRWERSSGQYVSKE